MLTVGPSSLPAEVRYVTAYLYLKTTELGCTTAYILIDNVSQPGVILTFMMCEEILHMRNRAMP